MVRLLGKSAGKSHPPRPTTAREGTQVPQRNSSATTTATTSAALANRTALAHKEEPIVYSDEECDLLSPSTRSSIRRLNSDTQAILDSLRTEEETPTTSSPCHPSTNSVLEDSSDSSMVNIVEDEDEHEEAQCDPFTASPPPPLLSAEDTAAVDHEYNHDSEDMYDSDDYHENLHHDTDNDDNSLDAELHKLNSLQEELRLDLLQQTSDTMRDALLQNSQSYEDTPEPLLTSSSFVVSNLHPDPQPANEEDEYEETASVDSTSSSSGLRQNYVIVDSFMANDTDPDVVVEHKNPATVTSLPSAATTTTTTKAPETKRATEEQEQPQDTELEENSSVISSTPSTPETIHPPSSPSVSEEPKRTSKKTTTRSEKNTPPSTTTSSSSSSTLTTSTISVSPVVPQPKQAPSTPSIEQKSSSSSMNNKKSLWIGFFVAVVLVVISFLVGEGKEGTQVVTSSTPVMDTPPPLIATTTTTAQQERLLEPEITEPLPQKPFSSVTFDDDEGDHDDKLQQQQPQDDDNDNVNADDSCTSEHQNDNTQPHVSLTPAASINFTSHDVLAAAGHNRLHEFQYYLSIQPEMNTVRDKNGWQPIHEAARGGHADMIDYLLRFRKNDGNNSPATSSQIRSTPPIPKLFEVVDVNSKVVGPVRIGSYTGATSLWIALQKLRSAGNNVDRYDRSISILRRFGGVAIAPTAGTVEEATQKAFTGAARTGAGAIKENIAFVSYAAATNMVDELDEYLTSFPEHATHVDTNGWQPIHEAARSGHANIIRVLLQKGKNVNINAEIGVDSLRGHHQPQWVGATPLWVARKYGLHENHKAVYMLKQFGGIAIAPYMHRKRHS
eukprot:CAMPEP_0195288686 /NCGR_PEP_ID=MMETSP0707-20130614/5256_1 /TAXON_ID=33640 /ORGANISM="Asterionellopsis glacialis, Strain CCMP134" /LENGTH=838 /DNA_ID=CAMNT_0040348585 /DNA_START=932 /DNA_END=3448 /DNA_ORIENTATION=+